MKKLIEWVEIPTADFSRAVNFYNKVFMLSLQEIDCGSEKMADKRQERTLEATLHRPHLSTDA